MRINVEDIAALGEKHSEYGKKLLEDADGKLYPCHALYLSVLNRSHELYVGFITLAEIDNYGCCMALLRMQLDNVLRFYGVLNTKDVHETANNIFKGTKLSSMKSSSGKPMRDVHLKEMLAVNNEWVERVYNITSGYIHLSDQHISHMLQKTTEEGNGQKCFFISATAEHVNEQHKMELVQAFKSVTNGVFGLLAEFQRINSQYSASELQSKYVLYT